MHARLRGPNNLFILCQIINRTDFPCLEDEIVEPHPGMNIKVATFTVSEKSINTITKYLQIYGEVDTQWAGRVPEVVSVMVYGQVVLLPVNTIKSRKLQ